jgi:ferric-dicitrate binding protein FerR (iron transport regulator)
MTKEQAISVLEQALNTATIKGSFNLNDVATILQALIQLKGE